MLCSFKPEGRTPTVKSTSSIIPTFFGSPNKPATSRKSEILLIVGLLLLGFVPVLAGQIRLVELMMGVEIIEANARFSVQPFPVVVHIIAASIYAWIGAFQFSSAVRRKAPNWHRAAGRVLVLCGLLVAFSGLWMSVVHVPDTDGPLLVFFRLVVSVGMILALVLGVRAIMRRQIAQHRAWMMRAYALAMGAGTQVFTLTMGALMLGSLNAVATAWLMGAGWMINILVVEWSIHRHNQMLRVFVQ